MTKFVVGSFNDFMGVKHQFVIAGTIMKSNSTKSFHIVEKFDGDLSYTDAQKVIGIGISICSPEDSFDLEIGKLQAEGRSKTNCSRIIAFSKGGMCNEKLLDLILEQHKMNLIENPGMFIKGYNAAEKKFKDSLANVPQMGSC